MLVCLSVRERGGIAKIRRGTTTTTAVEAVEKDRVRLTGCVLYVCAPLGSNLPSTGWAICALSSGKVFLTSCMCVCYATGHLLWLQTLNRAPPPPSSFLSCSMPLVFNFFFVLLLFYFISFVCLLNELIALYDDDWAEFFFFSFLFAVSTVVFVVGYLYSRENDDCGGPERGDCNCSFQMGGDGKELKKKKW